MTCNCAELAARVEALEQSRIKAERDIMELREAFLSEMERRYMLRSTLHDEDSTLPGSDRARDRKERKTAELQTPKETMEEVVWGKL